MASTLLSACVAPENAAVVPTDSPELTALPPRAAGMISGREYVLGQVVARQHERSAALQRQLAQRSDEVQRLHTEVEELRQREAELRTALDRAQASAGSTTAATSASVAPAERTRSAGNQIADAQHAETAAAAAAFELRQRQAEQEHHATVARLQAALTQEQQHRQEVETQLARLKEETSTPPYASPDAGQAELTAAKQQIVELRTALDEERAARERLAQDFRALQQRTAADAAKAQTVGGENAELRSRLQQLQEEKQNLTESFNRSLAESQRRAADLERQLGETRAGPSSDDGDGQGNVRAENSALRSRLDEEHRRTEELAAKLKVAMRVTDLIFKMQAQQAPPRY